MDTEIIAHQAGEPVDAAALFKAKGEWYTGQARPLLRLGRRALGRGTLADRFANFNILVATETRVLCYCADYGAGGPMPTELLGAWPRDAVGAESERREKLVSGNTGRMGQNVKLIRLRLATPDGPLTMDFQDDREARKLVKALR